MVKKITKRENGSSIGKLTRFVIIPLSLLLLWFGLTCFYIIHLDTSFSLLSYNLPKTVFTHLPQGRLEKGNYVSGEFVAQEKNLGIISLRFNTFFRPAYLNEDILYFQIKQKNAKDWYYENEYREGLIYGIPFFPFGFPIISDSKNKTYEFKITSLKGNGNNSVAVSNRWQNIAAKYKFSGKELLQSKNSFLQFSFKKFIISLQTIDVLFSSFVYFLPLLFYLILFFHFFKSFRRFLIVLLDVTLLSVILIDGLYLQLGNSLAYLLVPSLWIFVQRNLRFTSRGTFNAGMALLLLPPIFLHFNLGQTAENLAVWSYLFLVAGAIDILIDLTIKEFYFAKKAPNYD